MAARPQRPPSLAFVTWWHEMLHFEKSVHPTDRMGLSAVLLYSSRECLNVFARFVC